MSPSPRNVEIFLAKNHRNPDSSRASGPTSQAHPVEPVKKLLLKKEKLLISLNLEQIQKGDSFYGSTGEYTFTEPPDPDIGFLGSIVRDQEGKYFFLHPKHAEIQALASSIGQRIIDRYPEFSCFRFPEIRLENLNGNMIALMEYFGHHKELEDENILSADEKAFLIVLNLWMGNWDFKEDHIFVDETQPHEFGFIDLEKSFDFDNPEYLEEMARLMPFLDDGIPLKTYQKYVDSIEDLTASDKKALLREATEVGVDPKKTTSVIDALSKRKTVLADELEAVLAIHTNLKRLETQELDWAS